jgi:hypothetical protein
MNVKEFRLQLEELERQGLADLPVRVYEGTPGTHLGIGTYEAGPRVIEPTPALLVAERFVLVDSIGDDPAELQKGPRHG